MLELSIGASCRIALLFFCAKLKCYQLCIILKMKKSLIAIVAFLTVSSVNALEVMPQNPNATLDVESMTNCAYFYEYATGSYAQGIAQEVLKKVIKSKKDMQKKDLFTNYVQSMKSYMTLKSYLHTRLITLEDEVKYDEAATVLESSDASRATKLNELCIDYTKSAEKLNATAIQKKIDKETTQAYLAEVLWKSVKKQ